MRRIVLVSIVAALALGAAAPAEASRYVRYGIQDDAWLTYGPGSLDERLERLDALGVDLVRYTIRWDRVARKRPASPRAHGDRAYDWATTDTLLKGLRAHGIDAVVTLLGSPRWANGGRTSNWAPRSGRTFGDFAYAASRRYPWVHEWLIWNEPNQRRWLRPTSPSVYVHQLLNPAYIQLKRASRRNRVGGGVTAPRGNAGGVSPVDWIRGMAAARARLDAYAHHPYPTQPRSQTPWTGGCTHCETITMATLERLVREVGRSFGRKRIWLTEYGYQTSPPDRLLGVSTARQARFIGEAAHRAYAAPSVDMLIHFLVRDDSWLPGWQSGLFTAAGAVKPAYHSFRFPLAQAGRRGLTLRLWGQVRPGSGRQPFRVRRWGGSKWHWVGSTRWTNSRGVFTMAVRAGPGARFQIWSPRANGYSRALAVR